jgi:hypothetical protein
VLCAKGKTYRVGGFLARVPTSPNPSKGFTMKNDFYTYAYLRKDGTPYYIGKGRKNRAYTDGGRRVKLPSKDRILILKKNLTEEEAFRHEVYMIAVLGRKDLNTGILRNLSHGGEGSAGHKMPEDRKESLRQQYKGTGNPMFGVKPKSAEMRWFNLNGEKEKMFVPGSQPQGWNLGRKKPSEETLRKLKKREIRTGWKHKPDTILKIKEKAKKRPPVSEETKEKMRAAAKRRKGR